MGRIITQHAETPIILRYGQPLILTMAHGSSLGSLSPFFPVSSPLERHERIPRTHVEAIVLS